MQRLDGSTTLSSGLRLRLRLPQSSDGARLRRLLGDLGLQADDLQVSRWLRIDPRERVVVVAAVLAGRNEEVVGFAAIDRFASEPDLVLADEDRAPGTGAILRDALREHAERTRRIA
ncbi:MAG: hypothetical protein ACJ762_13005 [Solirubrobacteraceae bacterium]